MLYVLGNLLNRLDLFISFEVTFFFQIFFIILIPSQQNGLNKLKIRPLENPTISDPLNTSIAFSRSL